MVLSATTGFRLLRKAGITQTVADLLMLSSKMLSGIDRRLEWYDFGIRDLERNQKIIESWRATRSRTISTANWFVPAFGNTYAGVRNIFRFANFLVQKDIHNNIIIFGDRAETEHLINTTLAREFPGIKEATIFRSPPIDSIPYGDISFATYWTTAYPLLKFNNTKGKYYFIQDFEPLFYEAGSRYALTELTYRFGFQGITTAASLKEIYIREYGTEAEAIRPCMDRAIFYPNMKSPREKVERVVFYARPMASRNGFGLGMLALERIRRAHLDLKIVTVGSGLGGFYRSAGIENMGLLTLEQTGKLYRSCDIGIFLMFTPHPGTTPFELMASGCVLISNDNPSHRLELKNSCILCEPTVTRIVEAFELLWSNYDLRCDLFRQGLELTSKSTWEGEMEKAYRFITR
jgi:hypothetical protein